ncbi:hypothetical protein CF326_g9498 [Tilletia indica]|nr:hypothetical protein CF326_g9498 [Tilletia indica]
MSSSSAFLRASTRLRSSSNPPGPRQATPQPDEQEAPATTQTGDFQLLAEFLRDQPEAKDVVHALIKLKKSIPEAISMARSAFAGTPAKPVTQPRANVSPTLETGPPRTPRRARRESAPPSPSPQRTRKRKEDSGDQESYSKRPRQGATDLMNLTEEDFLGENDASFAELWPSAQTVAKIRKGEFVNMWYLTPAGCRHAALHKKRGTDENMLPQVDGSWKQVGHPTALVDDWDLSPNDFNTATGLWERVAERIGLPDHIRNQIVLLNYAICKHKQWHSHAKDLMEWHTFQRQVWSERIASGGIVFPLHKLDKEHYQEIKDLRTRATSDNAQTLAQQARPQQQQPHRPAQHQSQQQAVDPFRKVGGTGTAPPGRYSTQPGRSGSGMVCLRCGAHHPQPAQCNAQARADGSKPLLEADPATGQPRFRDNGEPVCVPYNTYGCKGTCKAGSHRCTWCGQHNSHGHQQCNRAPHQRR